MAEMSVTEPDMLTQALHYTTLLRSRLSYVLASTILSLCLLFLSRIANKKYFVNDSILPANFL
jgi:hypothetical protein